MFVYVGPVLGYFLCCQISLDKELLSHTGMGMKRDYIKQEFVSLDI